MEGIKPLSYTDPLDELKAIIALDYPDVNVDDYDLSLVKLETGAGRNTSILLTGNVNNNVMGSVKLNIDRLDPAAVFNRYGAVNKKHAVRLSAMAGASMKLSDILAHINNLLGTSLTLSGKFPDFADGNFVVPEKTQKVTVTIGAVDSATGDFPVSLRICPGKVLTLDVLNVGSVFTTKIINRSLNPFSSSTGKLVWTMEDQLVSAPTASTNLLLRGLDFSSVFGTYQKRYDALDQGNVIGLGTSGLNGYAIKPEPLAIINKILASAGIPQQASLRIARHVAHAWTSALNPVGQTSARTCTRTTNTATSSFNAVTTASQYTVRNPPPAAVNGEYYAVMKAYPASITTEIRDGSVSEDNKFMYLHFNELSL